MTPTAPNGLPIVGTLEFAWAISLVYVENGEVMYDGETRYPEEYWGYQKTATTSQGERIWVDSDYNHWSESQIDWHGFSIKL